MATLENLRKKGPLIAVVIGFALLAFILGDLVRSGKFIFSDGQFQMGEVAGESINLQEYQQKVDQVSEVYKMQRGGYLDEATTEQIRRQTWEQIIRDKVLKREYDELGIAVSNDELSDLVMGNNVDPTIRQLFTDPKTKRFNRAYVVQFINNLKNASPQQKDYWIFIENEVKRNREFGKYMNLVSKGLYTTTIEAKDEIGSKNKNVDIKYIVAKYNSISDSSVNVSNSEIKSYYEKHKEDFKQEASRDIQYITFNITPSPDDRRDTKRMAEELKNDFASTDDVEQFLRLNDPAHPFKRIHQKEDELTPDLAHELFNAEPGTVYGPYVEGNAYKLAKLVEKKNLPDTIKASHILIRPTAQTREAYDVARAKIDSLKLLVEGGADFAQLAKDNSADGSASKGGDLGWFKEGAMVRQFNDSCINSKPGDLKIAETQFGVHLIKVEEFGVLSPKVQIAILTKEIEPSKETIDKVYGQANKFIGLNNTGSKFDIGAEEQKLTKKIANNLTSMAQNIAGLGKARSLIRAANKANLNDIIKDDQGSPIFEFEKQFVVAKLIRIREKGYQNVEYVSQLIKAQLIKTKKADQLVEKINSKLQGASSIDALASALNLQVKENSNVNFAGYQIQGEGYEPKVTSAASSLDKGGISKPIDGNSGVFVVQVTNVNDNSNTVNLQSEILNIQKSLRSRAGFQAYDALKDKANVVDSRSKFY